MHHTQRNDIRLIHLQYNFGKFIGFNPISLTKKSLVSKLYLFLLFSAFLYLTIYTLRVRYDQYKNGCFLESALDIVECLSELTYVSMCLRMASFQKCTKHWKMLFQSLAATEKKFDQEKFVVKENTILTVLEIVFYHFVFSSVHIYENYVWIANNELNLVYSYISFRIAMCYQFLALIYVCSFSKMLRRRYDHLNKLIQDIIKERPINIERRHGSELAFKINHITSMYRSLHSVVHQLNAIFGWQIFFMLECAVLSILNSATFAFNSFRGGSGGSKWERGVTYIIMYPSIYIASTAALVMSCDAVEKSCKSITETCLLGAGGMANSVLREELLLLAKYTREFTPRFNAAGFFQVNQQLLGTLFSSITTYLIIIIQFHLSFKQICEQ